MNLQEAGRAFGEEVIHRARDIVDGEFELVMGVASLISLPLEKLGRLLTKRKLQRLRRGGKI